MKRLLLALALVAATTLPALADPTNDVKNAMINLAKATSYHMEGTFKDKTIVADMVPPSKMHMTMGTSMEMIKIDSEMYLKMGGSWRKFNIPGMDEMAHMFTGRIQTMSHPSTDMTVTDLGPKVIEGVPLHGYTVKAKSDDKVGTNMYTDGGGMLVRIEAPDNGIIRLSKFNQPMTIVAPI